MSPRTVIHQENSPARGSDRGGRSRRGGCPDGRFGGRRHRAGEHQLHRHAGERDHLGGGFPGSWNGTLLLYSHGFGPLTAPTPQTPAPRPRCSPAGTRWPGLSYDPNGSEWALDTAVSDQFGTLAAVESTVLPSRPAHVLAFGTSMGGLISALEAQQGAGKINGALTTCGIVGGGVNLNEYQIDGEYAIAQLLGNPSTQLVGFGNDTPALATASALTADATAAQTTAAGRARLALALAFLNATPWPSASTTPVPVSDPSGQEAAQYDVMFGGGFSILDFIELGRVSVEEADGGHATWDVGTNFAGALRARRSGTRSRPSTRRPA